MYIKCASAIACRCLLLCCWLLLLILLLIRFACFLAIALKIVLLLNANDSNRPILVQMPPLLLLIILCFVFCVLFCLFVMERINISIQVNTLFLLSSCKKGRHIHIKIYRHNAACFFSIVVVEVSHYLHSLSLIHRKKTNLLLLNE